MEISKRKRKAGILMHITSLPSPFGTGDFGPEAYAFADFLQRSKQKYWQVLPLNPVDGSSFYSPYSSPSSMAGNTLLISPEKLVEKGLLKSEDIEQHQLPYESQAKFKEAGEIKELLLERTFERFQQNADPWIEDFTSFCEHEKEWLDDYAAYMVLKKIHDRLPWNQWPTEFRDRKAAAMKELKTQHAVDIERVKWFQYIFQCQWMDLKGYCNQKGIQLFGDIPFYVNHDSADVWANRELFSLDKLGDPVKVAGVPPDYFNEDGQLWGMPIFDWELMKSRGYVWWLDRIRKNLQLFDIVRLDHFRAFAAYWEIEAGAETARQGIWKDGPAEDLFNALKNEFGEIPIIAEDLGDIDEAVHQLRRKFKLPGMRVLQFAFGDDLPHSDNIPHHFTADSVVYTGTHDNRTSLGWFRMNLTPEDKKRLNNYAGADVHEGNVHRELTRLAYASVAQIAILPTQDVIGLDESATMNIPGTVENNWTWRMLPDQLDQEMESFLRDLTYIYGRI